MSTPHSFCTNDHDRGMIVKMLKKPRTTVLPKSSTDFIQNQQVSGSSQSLSLSFEVSWCKETRIPASTWLFRTIIAPIGINFQSETASIMICEKYLEEWAIGAFGKIFSFPHTSEPARTSMIGIHTRNQIAFSISFPLNLCALDFASEGHCHQVTHYSKLSEAYRVARARDFAIKPEGGLDITLHRTIRCSIYLQLLV